MSQVVVYDANVLYPSTLRDVLIRVGLARLVQPKWTERILDEVFRNLRTNRPDLEPSRLDRTRRLMNDAIRDVTVTGYEYLIDQLELPDPDDRHVLAAAICTVSARGSSGLSRSPAWTMRSNSIASYCIPRPVTSREKRSLTASSGVMRLKEVALYHQGSISIRASVPRTLARTALRVASAE